MPFYNLKKLLLTSRRMPALFAQPPPPSYVTYIWSDLSHIKDGESAESMLNNSRRSTLFEARTTIESGTTGLRTWTASFILAEYLMLNPGKL